MNKHRFILQGIIVIVVLNTLVFGEINSYGQQLNDTTVQSIDLSSKNYYEQIFTKDERKQLKKANSYLESAKKSMLKYFENSREIEKLYTIAEATSSPKSREKSLLKARKLEQKSFKKGLDGLEYYKKSNDLKAQIYTSALNKIRQNDNSKYAVLGRELELQAKSNFENARSKERTAPQQDEKLKFNALNEANNLTLNALAKQENAIAIYEKDPRVNPDDFNLNKKQQIITNVVKKDSVKVVKTDSVWFPKYVEQYNPLTDPNLYHSKSNEIIPRLNVSNEELNALNDANLKNQQANELLKQVDDSYLLIDSLNFVADRTPDFTARDRIRNVAIEKEQSAFYKLTNATSIYIDVNETRYKVYKAHYPKIDEKKITPDLQKAKSFEKEADEYYLKAKNEISLANKQMYRSEQYIQMMGANDMLLYALQLQESAYGIYLGIPNDITESTDTAFVTKNKKNKSNKPTDKEKISKNLSWDVVSTFTYSTDKPKAVPYKTKKGVIFLVQLGVFKGIVPAENFSNVQPVIFDEFANNPNRRFMVGEFRSSEAAESALNKVKELGYTDAYIISMIDGQRKNYTSGKENINASDDHYKYLKRTELAKLAGEKNYAVEEKDKENEKPENNNISGNNIKNTKGLVYLVQLGMFSKPVTNDKFKGLQPIYTDKIQGKGTRYMFGIFNSLSKARAESKIAVDKGISDAYVIAYYDGENISLEKAKKLESKQGNIKEEKQVVSSSNVTFMVQVGAYRESLKPAEMSKLKTTYSPHAIEIKISDNMNVYVIGNYKTYKEADYLKKKLISEGHAGVFVVAFNGSQKIPVDQAIKLNNK
jgi:cell division protein FtsN